MEHDPRKIRRFAVQLPCTFTTSEQKGVGTILNLSAQGCAMMTECVPPVSSYLSLHIDLPDGSEPIDIELAGVRWVSEQRCGLEFIRISAEMLMQLRSFVLVIENTPS